MTNTYNTFGPNGLVSRHFYGGSGYFYAFDPVGGPAERLNPDATISNSSFFTAWGTRFSTWQSSESYSSFGGQWGGYFDQETGLVLFGSRYYDPTTGRFLTRDPIGYEGGINLYAYADNNPVNFSDPFGLDDGLSFADKFIIGFSTASGTFLGMVGGGAGGAAGGTLLEPGGGTIVGGAAGVVVGGVKGAAAGLAIGVELVALKHTLAHFMAQRNSGQLTLPGMPPKPAVSARGAQVAANRDNSAAAVTQLRQAIGGRTQKAFPTSLGKRVVDLLSNGVAHEVKVGLTDTTPFVRERIAKDAELLSKGRFNGVTWDFFRSPVTKKIGATQRLLDALRRAGIHYVIH